MANEKETDLSKKMRATGDPELVRLADDFDAKTEGFYAEPQTVDVRQFMGAWARARKAWCAHSGEALIKARLAHPTETGE